MITKTRKSKYTRLTYTYIYITVVYVYINSVFRSLNEGALIADFYRRDNRINEQTPTLSRLIKRVADLTEGGERVKIKKNKQNKVNPFTRTTTTTTVSVAMVCSTSKYTYTIAQTHAAATLLHRCVVYRYSGNT